MQFKINNRTIGQDSPVFIIAELSANHNNDFDLAVKTLKAMKKSGADAVKVQVYTADDITLDVDTPIFQTRHDTKWAGQKLYDLYKKASIPYEWYGKLNKVAADLDIIIFASAFSRNGVDLLEEFDAPIYKIASPEITDIPLIEYISSKGKPIILSSGIASLADIDLAISTCKKNSNDQIAILKCTTAYPTPFDEVNLRTIPNMESTFNIIPGLSDHTMGIAIPIAAVALGAKIIEKHFILDRKINSPDSFFSLEPEEFTEMVKSIRNVEEALGKVSYTLSDKIKDNKLAARSLFTVVDIKKGEDFTEKNIKSIRPGYGLHPKYLAEIIGKRALADVKKGTPMKWSLINFKK